MKNLPLWTKTLAVASLTLFGAAACDSGNNTQTTAGTEEPQQNDNYVKESGFDNLDQQDEDVVMEQDRFGQNQNDSTLEQQDIDMYGQQNNTNQDTQPGAQTEDQLSDQRDMQQPQDDTVVQRD